MSGTEAWRTPLVGNPLLDEYLKVNGGRQRFGLDIFDPVNEKPQDFVKHIMESYRARTMLTQQYAWAVPNAAALRAIADCSPLIEIGAGRGYWAALLEREGADIIAFDDRPPTKARRNFWHRRHGLYFPVKKGSAEVVARHDRRALFLCWPPYEQAMAETAALAYTGRTIVYIGEYGGCTASEPFHDILESEFEEEAQIPIPQWAGMHDRLYIYRRK